MLVDGDSSEKDLVAYISNLKKSIDAFESHVYTNILVKYQDESVTFKTRSYSNNGDLTNDFIRVASETPHNVRRLVQGSRP